jgi:hypothetical protein
MNKLLIALCLSLVLTYSCKTDNAETLYPDKPACDTVNMQYGANIQPIIQVNCLNQGCHTSGNPSGGYQFDNYNNFKITITGGKLLNAVHYVTGRAKNMPPTGKLSDCDISRIEAWVNRGYPNN